jgi:hypothetical protein
MTKKAKSPSEITYISNSYVALPNYKQSAIDKIDRIANHIQHEANSNKRLQVQYCISASAMAEAKNVEQRLMDVLEVPSNQNCSECDREQNKPVWAAFLVCPVDQKRLGVVCCKKCFNLFQDVKDDDCDFTVKSLTQLNDCKCPHAGVRHRDHEATVISQS